MEALDPRLSSWVDALDQKVERYWEDPAGWIDSQATHFDTRIAVLEEKLTRRTDALGAKLRAWLRWLMGVLVVALMGQLGVLAPAVFR